MVIMFRSFLLIIMLSLTGCTRDVVIQQGHFQTTELIEQARGQDAAAVRELLGPPQSRWQLEQEVWLYYYYFKDREREERFTAELRFGPDGTVEDIIITKNPQENG